MKINSLYLQNLLRTADCYNHWPDYFSLTTKDVLEFWHYFDLLNKSNTPTAHIQWELFTYTLQKDARSKMSTIWINIAIEDIPYGIVKVIDFRQNSWIIKSNFSVIIPWTLFRLAEIWEISCIFDVLFDVFSKEDMQSITFWNVTRLDYKIDLMFDKEARSIPKSKKLISTKLDPKSQIFSITEADHRDYMKIASSLREWWKLTYENIRELSDGEYATWWSIGSKKTKRQMTRCYEKKLDVLSKWKRWLYQDYFNYWTVRRIETEFHDNFLKRDPKNRIIWECYNELLEKAQSFFWLNKAREKRKYFYAPNPKLDSVNIRYKRNYCRRWEKIRRNWENSFLILKDYLLEKWYDAEKINDEISNAFHR